jgi:hypothetical protein
MTLSVPEVYEAILGGVPASMVAPHLIQLPPGERQNLLCTVCSMHSEIARNCIATANEVQNLLTAECPYYVDGVATCLLEDQVV